MAPSQNKKERIEWPKRAVVTAGMPYGNKSLHFGHVGGVFVPADCYARFLRDRIGPENVVFVSGTDCFGSPIEEGYRKEVESGSFEGTLEDYVRRNHDRQKATLDAYDISLDVYEGSGLGHCGEVHRSISAAFVQRLHEKGFLHLESTLQFYDAQEGMFLNGRQVVGHCPVQGCKSEKAYADECDLGHQYDPVDLINPISSVSGTVPEMREVRNWYFDLPGLSNVVRDYVDALESDPCIRPVVTKTIKEFLVPPIIYIKVELHDKYLEIADKLPKHVYRDAAKGKQSFEIEFENVYDRDKARTVLADANIRFRTGKALVPFRISGNVEWGVPVPEIEGVDGLTVWWLRFPSPWRVTTIAVFPARHGALSGAKKMQRCISSSARTTCISMALPSPPCSPLFRKSSPWLPMLPKVNCSRQNSSPITISCLATRRPLPLVR